ncbi:MAG: hypothetical protein CVV61_01665 [Tenericutes bacterium HGW-Tenericutes-6]|nr:MAG: hypothetical protein CVV61_01665 [Tenericutes bacterium HGW-Tenericutes-6]
MRTKSILLYLLIFTSLLSLITMTYAYFKASNNYVIELNLGGLSLNAYISFDGVYIDQDSPYYDPITQTVIVEAFDASKPNYIEHLKIDITLSSKIASKMRFMIKDEWILTRTFNPDAMYPMDPVIESIYFSEQSDIYFPYSYLKKGDLSLFKFHDDGYAYYLPTIDKNETVMINLISGGKPYLVRENDLYVETCVIRIGLEVELVQANRFYEIWGIDQTFYQS